MKKIYISCGLSLFSFLGFGQHPNDEISRDSIIAKWIKAVISIECTESIDKKINFITGRLVRREIDTVEANKEAAFVQEHPNKLWGTAILLEYQKDTFLLSARHVFADTGQYDTNAVYHDIVLMENPSTFLNTPGKSILIDTPTTKSIPGVITILNPNVTINHIYIDRGDDEEGISLNSVYTPNKEKNRKKYKLSPTDTDIGLIDLNNCNYEGKAFLKTLTRRGYQPIKLSDIDNFENVRKLDSILCFGYPMESFTGRREISAFRGMFENNIQAIPMITEGIVTLSERKSPFFEAGIFTYHGSSGGPIVKNNRLIGLVNGFYQSVNQLSSPLLGAYWLYRPKFVKSSIIRQFIETFYSDNQ